MSKEALQATLDYLIEFYQAIHCIKHHECRRESRIIGEAIQILEGKEVENELPNCDCYECGNV